MTSEISGELKLGDFIAVASGSYIQLAFYLGRGRSGTVQYFTVDGLDYWLQNKDNPKNRWMFGKKKPYVSYVNSAHKTRFVKFHPDLIENEEIKIKYNNAIESLKILKIK